eukprot:PITA_23333
MDDDKLLWHIISKDGICIDPARVEAIQQIDMPRNKKEIQYFNVQTDPEGRRGKWIAALLEYGVEIKPTNLVKRQGLVKLIVESNLHALDINLIDAMFDENEEGLSIQKDPGGVLLNYLVEEEAKQVMEDFHKGDCGSHLFWKTTANKILRAAYYWPTLFVDVYKWGLDFIGEIHPASSSQHRWILTATDYFTKWIEAIPTRQATDVVIISFLENNILSRFGCPSKLITDNAATFKSKRMIEFCNKYKIILVHSTTYRPQGNGLVESSNKSLVNIIKKLLEINKKSWHKKLVNALWEDQVSQNKSIGMSLFELVYAVDIVFPTSLAALVVKLLQEACSEEDPMWRRLNQMVHLQQTREEVFQNTSNLQEKIKKIYDREAKADKFQLEEVVLKGDARNEEKGNHSKFENLWKDPFKIVAYCGQNAFLLKEINREECLGGLVNGRLLKRYHF